MTFDPVLPALVLGVVGVALIALRLFTLRGLGGKSWPALLRWGGLTFALLLMLAAAFRPSISGSDETAASAQGGPGMNVFFVVDRSVDSRVADFGDRQWRMAGIRADLAALVDKHPGARFAVISFSSAADLTWPLSEDVWSLQAAIAGLSPYTRAAPDATFQVDAGAAADILTYKLQQARQQYPDSPNLVYYFGSGAGGSRVPQSPFGTKPTGGAVLGYGTTAGGPIPDQVVDGELQYAADAQGTRLINAIDEPELNAIAEQLGVPYVHRQAGQGIGAVTAETAPDRFDTSGAGAPVELYWMLTLLAADLLLLEIFLTIRQHRRHRGPARDVT